MMNLNFAAKSKNISESLLNFRLTIRKCDKQVMEAAFILVT